VTGTWKPPTGLTPMARATLEVLRMSLRIRPHPMMSRASPIALYAQQRKWVRL